MITGLKKWVVKGSLILCLTLAGFGGFGTVLGTLGTADLSAMNTGYTFSTAQINAISAYDRLIASEGYLRNMVDAVEKALTAKKEVKHAQGIQPKAAAGTYTSEAGAAPLDWTGESGSVRDDRAA